MKISIIILSYNDYSGTTGPCLASLSNDPAFPTWEVFVVDNASNAETRDSLLSAQAQYPSVHFVLNEQNIGYAAGNNVGIRLSTGGVVILLNSDTIAPAGMIEKLAAHFINHPRLGMIGPVTNAAGNEQAILASAESIEGKSEQGLRYANSGGNELLVTYRMDFHCVAIARAVINKVGLLDEEFGRGYYEDFDYSLRVKNAGFDLRVAEDVFVYHRGSASFSKLPRETKELMKRNKKRMLRKHGSQVLFLHLRDGNLGILAQYAERMNAGLALPDYRIQSRIEFAIKNQPRSWFKKWRYLNRVKKIAHTLNIKIGE
ncbi:MAG: glycosyltransferase [Gallionellaceae bacterium]|nr:glycosyltransferase [Gallionellaceae bacterium]